VHLCLVVKDTLRREIRTICMLCGWTCRCMLYRREWKWSRCEATVKKSWKKMKDWVTYGLKLLKKKSSCPCSPGF
jgi:hypothetical protein